MNLSITPELQQLIQRKVDSGMYSNASEVVRDALRRMDEQDAWRELRMTLEPRIAAARAGETVTSDMDAVIEKARHRNQTPS